MSDGIDVSLETLNSGDWALLFERFEKSDLPLSFSDYTRPINIGFFMKMLDAMGMIIFAYKTRVADKGEVVQAYVGIYNHSVRNNSANLFFLSNLKVGCDLYMSILRMFNDWLFRERGFRKVKIHLFNDMNGTMIKILEGMGYEREGILRDEVLVKGRYKDIAILSKFNAAVNSDK